MLGRLLDCVTMNLVYVLFRFGLRRAAGLGCGGLRRAAAATGLGCGGPLPLHGVVALIILAQVWLQRRRCSQSMYVSGSLDFVVS